MSRQRPLQVCLVGLGHIGKIHVAALGIINSLELVAGCDKNGELASVLPAEARFHKRLDAALVDPEIDLIVVATPNNTHNQIARAALAAGRNVIVEKPAAADHLELAALNICAHRSKRLLWFAFHASTASEVLWTAEHLVNNRDLYGELSAFHCRFFDPYLGSDQNKQTQTKSLETPWRDSGINAISVLQRLLPDLALEASCLRRSKRRTDGSEVLSETAHFRFGNAGYGCIETAWDQQLNHKSTELFFAATGTRLLIDHSLQTVCRWRKGGEKEVLATFRGERLLNHYLNLFKEAAEGINTNKNNAVAGERAHVLYFSVLKKISAT